MEHHPASRLDFSGAITMFDRLDMIAVDTETNAKDVRDGSGLCYGVAIAGRVPAFGICTYYFSLHHPDTKELHSNNLDSDALFKLRQAFNKFRGILLFHNAKFDLESLATVGIVYTGRFICTMNLAHILNENFPLEKNLENCVKMYVGIEGKKKSPLFQMYEALVGWAGMPTPVIEEYAEYDALSALLLGEELIRRAEREGVMDYWWEQKMPFTNVIRTMERRGINIDVAKCEKMTAQGQWIMEDILELLGLNPGSRNDMEELLINRLHLPVVKRSKKTNQPSFDKEAMIEYEEMLEWRANPVAQYILTYRGWQKAVSSCYVPYVTKRSTIDGKLRCNYKLHGTKTGRSSCYEPNLQQIPRSGDKEWNGEMKSCFLPMDDFELWEFDFAQLELRLGTAYADEPTLKAVFNEDRDIFEEMAGPMGMPRHATKTFVYATQYGAGITRIKNLFNITTDKAAEIRDTYQKAYPGFHQKSKVAAYRAFTNKKVKLWSGRYRHFVNPESEAHKAWNSVIQGGAADIVERAMIRVYNNVDDEETCRMLLTVHDSIVVEIRKDKVAADVPRIIAEMENVGPEFGVRFKVEAKRFGEK